VISYERSIVEKYGSAQIKRRENQGGKYISYGGDDLLLPPHVQFVIPNFNFNSWRGA
jgi:hypothetical protein